MLLGFGEERPDELLLEALEGAPALLAIPSLLCILSNNLVFGRRHQLDMLLFLSQLSESDQSDLSQSNNLCEGLQESSD